MTSDVLKTTKNYIPNTTIYIKIFSFESSFESRVVRKKRTFSWHNPECEFFFKSWNYEWFSDIWDVLFVRFDNFWFTIFLRMYNEANFSISVIDFKIMDLDILKDIPSSMKKDKIRRVQNEQKRHTKHD